MDLRMTIPSVAIAAACLVIVTTRTLSAQSPTPRRHADPSERAEIARTIATAEVDWSKETERNFPEDYWSQRDDFHGRELKAVLQISRDKGILLEDVLRAIDDDIHQRKAPSAEAEGDRHARAIPCKPRPFYD